MDESDIQRLLTEKWSSLRHIEAERHWFLAFYAVISAGFLAFLAQRPLAGPSSADFYLILAGLGLVGLLHAFRAAWSLGQVHHDLNKITKIWEQGEALSLLIPYWGFDRVESFTKGLGGLLNWILSQYLFKFGKGRVPIKFVPPTFTALYIWVYTIPVVVFLCFGFQSR